MLAPLSKRLALCASMVSPAARVADIGADHGYLGIRLLQTGAASYVAACDLRPGPLENAKCNAKRAGVAERMDFFLCDGLKGICPGSVNTVVCAGMGGELIIKILSEAPWLQDVSYTLILQPQTDIALLRRWLGAHCFYEEKADLIEDAGFLYCAMRVRFGRVMELTPGQEYVSPVLEASRNPLLAPYIARRAATVRHIVEGLSKAGTIQDPARLARLTEALRELTEMEGHYVNRL